MEFHIQFNCSVIYKSVVPENTIILAPILATTPVIIVMPAGPCILLRMLNHPSDILVPQIDIQFTGLCQNSWQYQVRIYNLWLDAIWVYVCFRKIFARNKQ